MEFFYATVLPLLNVIAFSFSACVYGYLVWASLRYATAKRGLFAGLFFLLTATSAWFAYGYWLILFGHIEVGIAYKMFRPFAWALPLFPSLVFVGILIESEKAKQRALRLLNEEN